MKTRDKWFFGIAAIALIGVMALEHYAKEHLRPSAAITCIKNPVGNSCIHTMVPKEPKVSEDFTDTGVGCTDNCLES